MTGHAEIEAIGVRTHNLRGIDVRLPHRAIVAVTGVSGSGKSSLVVDTLHAEARLRYAEGFDPYVRSFLTPRDRPQVDRIRGLTATLAVGQRNANSNPRSTLGTLTGLAAYAGLVFARLGPLASGNEWTGPLHPAQFDPYSRDGICPACIGAREIVRAVPERIVSRPDRPLLDGGSSWFGRSLSTEEPALPSLALHHDTDLARPWRAQPEPFRHAVLYGTGGAEIDVRYTGGDRRKGTELTYRTRQALAGAVAEVERAYAAAGPEARHIYLPFVDRRPCPECDGSGLGRIARTVTLGGRTFADVTDDTVSAVREWARTVAAGLNDAQRTIGAVLVPELRDRLDLLIRLGIGHLALSRGAPTLSGGELQRARLSAQISTALTGLTYVFDEPGAGLHPADKEPLVQILRELRDAGNTVLLVEHDPDLIARADWIVDLGPGGGRDGGRLVASGPPDTIAGDPRSVTGRYLREPDYRLHRTARAPDTSDGWLVLRDVAVHHVSAAEIRVPLRRLTCLTGVSGSGKSTVLHRVVADSVAAALAGRPLAAAGGVAGADALRWVTVADQRPIGRTPRSSPATYTKAFDLIRPLFAGTDEARTRGLDDASMFSFNSPGGRCEDCQGLGRVKLDMHFLGDTYLTCPRCDGRRYGPDVLAVRYRGLAVDEVLTATVAQAATVFDRPLALVALLQAMTDVGLGHLTLGESATALSGGEAQRLKLARAIVRGRDGRAPGLVVLDEPVTGLHPADAQQFLGVLDRLLDRGHTVVMAEQDPHAAAAADWIVDLGPGAGPAGGRIINAGPPAHVAHGSGPTAPHLRRLVG